MFCKTKFQHYFWVSPSAISKLKARSHMRVDIRDRLCSRCPNITNTLSVQYSVFYRFAIKVWRTIFLMVLYPDNLEQTAQSVLGGLPSLLVSFSVDNGCKWTLNVYRNITFSNESRLCLLQLAHSVKCQSMERMWRTLCWFMHRYGESFWWRQCDGEEQHLPQWKNKASHHW